MHYIKLTDTQIFAVLGMQPGQRNACFMRVSDGLVDWLNYYNGQRTHQGKMCCGRTPMQTLMDAKEVWDEKVKVLN